MGTEGGARPGRRTRRPDRAGRREPMVDVDMVEVDAIDDVRALERAAVRAAGDAAGTATGPHGEPRPGAAGPDVLELPAESPPWEGVPSRPVHRWGWWAAAAAAVLLVLGGLGDAVERRRDAVLVAAYGDVPGVVPSLREPLAERSRWPTAQVRGITDDLVLVERPGRDGPVLEAHDPDSRELRWSVPSPAQDRPMWCTTAGDRLVCEVVGSGIGSPTTDALLGEVPGLLLALSAEDGRVLTTWTLGSSTVGWAVLGDDVVLARRGQDGVTVTRRDPTTDEEVWTGGVEVPEEVLAADLWLETAEGLVLLQGAFAAVLDGADGSELGRWSALGRVLPAQLRATPSGFVLWDGGTGTWHDRRGAPGLVVRGRPADPAVRDGSAPEVLLVTRERRLLAVDLRSGTVLWERAEPADVVLRLDAHVLVVDRGHVRSLDVRTGQESWAQETALVDPLGIAALSDGRRVLVPGYEVTTGRYVSAYDLGTGEEVWRVGLPPGSQTVVGWGGRVVAPHREEVVVLGGL